MQQVKQTIAMNNDQSWLSSSLLTILLLPTILVGMVGAWLVLMKGKDDDGRKPPGPRGLPILGHLHLLGKLPHQSLCELSKQHGPLMSLRLGSVPIVVVSSPDLARHILKEQDLTFGDRRLSAVGNYIFGGATGIVFSSASSPYWKLLRRISASELLSAKQLDRFRSVRAAEARGLMRAVLADCGATASADWTAVASAAPPGAGQCCLRPKLLQALSDIVTKMMTGKTLTELAGDEATRILKLIVKVPKLLGEFNVSDYLPFLAWMDLQGCERRSKKLAAELREAFERIVETRRQAGAANKVVDAHFLDALLECEASSSSTPVSIMENFLAFFVGGTDTCAATIEWAFAELLTNPEKMFLVQDEIERVVGRARVVGEEDIAHLPYLIACVKETMRLHPAVPLLMPHGTNQACEILNFQILPNTQAYVNVWAIGRDSRVWEHPDRFLPERFLEVDPIDMQGQHFELLPFGAGRRICPGLRLALLTINLILASLLQGFEWSLSPSQHIDMTEHFGAIVSMKTPLVASTIPHLSTELYK
ncbi:hypothetical protein GOP47_0015484 [Adiantum capillus-veneris]|uniref:Cytochrome P450 n=1 Tax=Adiantum capillus-veneris TaxID=13818 RepID=A0A9D4UKX6_ADICA|nr:hypothetical protein GOP47_0015484 [Adiantum capillus-veneris]